MDDKDRRVKHFVCKVNGRYQYCYTSNDSIVSQLITTYQWKIVETFDTADEAIKYCYEKNKEL